MKFRFLNINVQAFYILGLLDDDVQSMKRTVRYSFQLNCFAAQFCVLTPFPGTKTYHDLKSRLLTTDFRKFNEYDPVVKIDGATAAEIVGLRDWAVSAYYLRPRWYSKHIKQIGKSIALSLKYH